MTQLLNKPIAETLDAVRARVLDTNPVDRRTPLGRFIFRPNEGQPYLQPLRPDGGPTTELLPPKIHLSDLALEQILQRVGYPKKLFERLPENNVMLDVNHLIQALGADRHALLRLVRHESLEDVDGVQARAILGSRYTPMDDLMLFETCADFLEGATVRYEAFGPVSTHLTVTWEPETPEEVEQQIHRGIHIANSEVGMRSITIGAVVYREVCSNVLPAVGLHGSGTGSDGNLYVRKAGSGAHDFKGALRGSLEAGWRFYHQGDPNMLRDFVRDAISDSRKQFEGVMARWREGLSKAVEDPIAAIEKLSDANDLTADQLKKILMGWSEEKVESGAEFANSVTGIVNGFTRAAQDFADPEERYKIEVAGASGFVYLN